LDVLSEEASAAAAGASHCLAMIQIPGHAFYREGSDLLRGRMFPNIRLATVALFASIVALRCDLGVFAAFAVSLRPLAHRPIDTGSLQHPLADHCA
jgi:hypothetical protein